MNNTRFAEYTTSGAFALSLTRNQVASLSMLDGGSPDYTAHLLTALERKGLAERFPAPTEMDPDRIEFRLTRAGLLTAELCGEAGLTNGEPDPTGRELAALRAEVADLRAKAADAIRLADAAIARREVAEGNLENERRMAAGKKQALFIHRRDPLPDLSDADLTTMVRVREP